MTDISVILDIEDKGDVMELTDELRNFILNWGEKLSHWGLNRTECQVYSLLFISPNPMTIEEIAETLNVARSNASNSLKELQSWKIVKVVSVSGDRRKYYECMKDVWQLFRQVVHEQKQREIDPMVDILHEIDQCLQNKTKKTEAEGYALEKIQNIQDFFDVTAKWYDRLHQMDPELLTKYVKLAANIEKFIKK